MRTVPISRSLVLPRRSSPHGELDYRSSPSSRLGRRLVSVTFLAAFVILSLVSRAQEAATVVGDLRVESFHSSIFGDTQTLRVWLPAGYRDPANATRRYPVLYLLDGQNLFDSKTAMFGVEWQVDETLTRLISEGKVEPVIVVGIDSPPGTRREAEYLPYPDYLNEPQTVVEGTRFPDFMVTEVLPRIEKEYRARTEARGRGIGGGGV